MTPRNWILLSLVFHILASIFNVGYQYYDEYFQTIEFASYKAGITPASVLAWEFPAQIRSWFLPGFVWLMIKIGQASGFESARGQIFLTQLTFSLLGWFSLVVFYSTWIRTQNLKRETQTQLWMWMALFWFFPYFHVRTSSENVATSFWLLGLSLLIQPERKRVKDLASGFLLGLAFLARFQTALLTVGLVFWRLVSFFRSPDRSRKAKASELIFSLSTVLGGLVLAYGVGFLLDRWGYGVWTHSAWNYFRVNLIEHKADSFGVNPWWHYFEMLRVQVPLGLGYLIPLVFLIGCLLSPMSPLTWASGFFIGVHLLIGHKEMRFIYPLAPFFPIFLLEVYRVAQRAASRLRRRWKRPAITLGRTLYLYTLLSCGALAITSAFKAERNPFHWLGYISAHFQDSLELAGWTQDPFMDIFPMWFYRPKNYQYTQVESPKELEALLQSNPNLYVFRPENEVTPEYRPVLAQCHLKYEIFSGVFHSLNINQWLSRAGNWGLYACGEGISTNAKASGSKQSLQSKADLPEQSAKQRRE